MPAPELFAFVTDAAQARKVADYVRFNHFEETTVEVREATTGEGCVAVLAEFPIGDAVREITGRDPLRLITAEELQKAPDRFGLPLLGAAPEDDAYSRVTRPDRYQMVVDAAHATMDRLQATHEVERSDGELGDLDPERWPRAVVTRLDPSEGAPIVLGMTDFPGVIVRAGNWFVEGFPTCGCDACDEQPLDVVEALEEVVEGVIGGQFTEVLTKASVSFSFTAERGGTQVERKLERGEWKSLGTPGTHEWLPWPKRVVSI